MSTLLQQVGRDDARRMWDISVEGVELLRRRVEQHQIDCDLHWGQMHVGVRPRHTAELSEWQKELEQEYGYAGLKYLSKLEVGEWLATDRYNSGLYDPRGGHLHPLNYTLGLARAAEAAGVRIYEGTPVTSLRPGDPLRIETGRGSVTASYAVAGRGGYLDDLKLKSDWRVMPVGTYVVATEPLGEERISALIRRNVAIADVNFVLDYFRRSADHRLLFGGRVSYSGIDALNTGRATRARMVKVFPQLADVRIDYAWGGFVDITMNRAPDFGRLGSNVFYLQGFSGHGIAMAGMAGQLAAEAIAGQAERFDMFSRIPHQAFPGGRTLRTPALVLAMLWFRLKDLL
jgi:gamma-glutamylputrescine oxidase